MGQVHNHDLIFIETSFFFFFLFFIFLFIYLFFDKSCCNSVPREVRTCKNLLMETLAH